MSKNLFHSLPHLVALVRVAPYSPITMIYHLAKYDAWTVAQSTGARLVWEESRGGKLFPHVYGDIPLSAVKQATPLSLNADGIHQFPELGSENGAD